MPRTEWAARSRKLVNGDFAQAFLGNTREGTAAICITAFSSLVARPIVATRIIYTEFADGGAFLREEDKKVAAKVAEDWADITSLFINEGKYNAALTGIRM